MKRNNTKTAEKRNRSHSQKPAVTEKERSKTTSYTQGDKVPEDIEEILFDISLKKPKSAFNYFIKDCMDKDKTMKNVTMATKAYAKKWPKVSNADRKKYDEMAEKDKERYREHLEIVRKNILQKPLKENVTAYRIYLEEHVKKAIENNENVQEAKKRAAAEWKDMKLEERKEYSEKRKEHIEWYESLKKSHGSVNAYALYMRDMMQGAREKGETMTMKQCAEKWAKSKTSVKEKYAQFAEEKNEERDKHRDLYEIAYGIKPRRPLGAFKFFLIEAAKEGKFEGVNPLIEGHKLFNKLTDEQKEKYQRIAQREKLAYMVKKMEYDAVVKKTSTHRPLSAMNIFMQDMKDKVSAEDYNKEGFFNYCYKKWHKLDDANIRKYQRRAEESKAESAQINEGLKSRVYNKPRKPANTYNIFIQHINPELREHNPKKSATEIFKMAGDKWQTLSDKQKEKYAKLYEKELEQYEAQMEEWNQNGYYDTGKENRGRKRKSSQSKAETASVSASNTKRGKKSVKE
jgi:transcription factor A